MSILGEQIIRPGAHHAFVNRLHEKRRLLAAGDSAHEAIRTALIISGGGMRGVYSTGITAGLEAIGMREVFDDAIGISAGACAVAYLLAGQAEVGPSVYYEDLPNRRFINILRPKAMDINFLEHIFRNLKPLNQAALRHARTKMHVGLTEVATGKGVYLNVSDNPQLDIISAVITSSALPGVAKQQAALNGILYADGSTGCTTPIDYAIETLGATDILVIMNYPFSRVEKLPASARLLERIILRRHSRDFRAAHLNRFNNHGFSANKSYGDVNIGVLCPEKQRVGPFSKDAKTLNSTYAKSSPSLK